MTPNLFVAAKTVCSPHRWFHSKGEKVLLDRVEIWNSPVPGVYKHRPGAGWFLVAAQDSSEFLELDNPIPVVYAKALHKYIFEEDFYERIVEGYLQDKPRQKDAMAFFRLDDQVTYIHCYDNGGDFIPGPYQRYVFDETTKRFRPMLRRDDPEWYTESVSRRHGSSAASSLHTSRDNSACPSRKSSFDDQRSPSSQVKAGSRNSLQPPQENHTRASSEKTSRSSSRSR